MLQSSLHTAHQWHSKLGHPSLPKLQVMLPSLKSLSRLDCESCQLSKQPRASFPISVFSGSSKPFDLVHSDVWGPVSVTNYFKFKYYLLFIDDFTRMTWLYLIHDRSEVLTCFEQFLHEIQMQFSTIIKTFRSDNSPVHKLRQFQSLIHSHGIHHKTSCLDTHNKIGGGWGVLGLVVDGQKHV